MSSWFTSGLRKLQHRMNKKSDQEDLSPQFQTANQSWKDARKGLASIHRASASFASAARVFAGSLKNLGTELSANVQCMEAAAPDSVVVGSEGARALETQLIAFGRVCERLAQAASSSVPGPESAFLRSHTARAREQKDNVYESLRVRNQLANRIDALNSKGGHQQQLIQVQAEHKTAATAFDKVQTDAAVATAAISTEVARRCGHGVLAIVGALATTASEFHTVAERLRTAVKEHQPAAVSAGSATLVRAPSAGAVATLAPHHRAALLPLWCLPPLLPGERTSLLARDVTDRGSSCLGVLRVTTYRLQFFPYPASLDQARRVMARAAQAGFRRWGQLGAPRSLDDIEASPSAAGNADGRGDAKGAGVAAPPALSRGRVIAASPGAGEDTGPAAAAGRGRARSGSFSGGGGGLADAVDSAVALVTAMADAEVGADPHLRDRAHSLFDLPPSAARHLDAAGDGLAGPWISSAWPAGRRRRRSSHRTAAASSAFSSGDGSLLRCISIPLRAIARCESRDRRAEENVETIIAPRLPRSGSTRAASFSADFGAAARSGWSDLLQEAAANPEAFWSGVVGASKSATLMASPAARARNATSHVAPASRPAASKAAAAGAAVAPFVEPGAASPLAEDEAAGGAAASDAAGLMAETMGRLQRAWLRRRTGFHEGLLLVTHDLSAVVLGFERAFSVGRAAAPAPGLRGAGGGGGGDGLVVGSKALGTLQVPEWEVEAEEERAGRVELDAPARVLLTMLLSSPLTATDAVRELERSGMWLGDLGFAEDHARAVNALVESGTAPSPTRGLRVFSWAEECRRMAGQAPSPLFRLEREVNADFQLQPTYPAAYMVPATLAPEAIRAAAAFRSKKRGVAISWFCGGLSLSRCSQPKVGIFSNKSQADIDMLQELLELARRSPAPGCDAPSRLLVIDARPRMNAQANRTQGGGSEVPAHYPTADIVFANIDNIHVVRGALRKLKAAVQVGGEDWELPQAPPVRSASASWSAGGMAGLPLGDEEEGEGSGAVVGDSPGVGPSSGYSTGSEGEESDLEEGAVQRAVEREMHVVGEQGLGAAASPSLGEGIERANEDGGDADDAAADDDDDDDAAENDDDDESVGEAATGFAIPEEEPPAEVGSRLARLRLLDGVAAFSNRLSLGPCAAPAASKAADSQWLQLMSTLLKAVVRMARSIANGQPVLVHCSDGWDRTAQLSSLTLLCVDPYYRTFKGFLALIDREWISFGHQFSRRLGQGGRHDRRKAKDKQRSPIFHQFLDAVWQLGRQDQTLFEFNELLLVALATHCTSGRYGTFLGDNQLERTSNDFRGRTLSLWDALLDDPRPFLNTSFAARTLGVGGAGADEAAAAAGAGTDWLASAAAARQHVLESADEAVKLADCPSIAPFVWTPHAETARLGLFPLWPALWVG